MDHQGSPITTDQVGLTTSVFSLILFLSISLSHLAGSGLQRQPHLQSSPSIMAITIFMWTPRSPSSPISSHHCIHPSVWFGLLGIELGFVDLGIFNQRQVIILEEKGAEFDANSVVFSLFGLSSSYQLEINLQINQ